MSRTENKFQADLVRHIQERFPGCIVLKNDEQYIQGIPDLTVLWGPFYALLEVKKSPGERSQPNQFYYLNEVTSMGGFASYVYPENEDEVLDAIQHAFESRR